MSSKDTQLFDLDSSPAQRLCSACRRIFNGTSRRATSRNIPWEIPFQHQESASLLELTAQGNCPICIVLWRSFTAEEQDRLRRFRSSLGSSILAQAKKLDVVRKSLIPVSWRFDSYTWTVVQHDELQLRFDFNSGDVHDAKSSWRSVLLDIYCARDCHLQTTRYMSWRQGMNGADYSLHEEENRASVDVFLGGYVPFPNMGSECTIDRIRS